MRGTVSKYTTASGQPRWRITYDLGPEPETGKRRQTTRRGFTREKDAHAALRKILGTVEDGSYIAPERVTVEEWLREWHEQRKPRGEATARRHRGQVGIGTWAAEAQYVDTYLVPGIGPIRLQALSPADVNRLYDTLEATGGRSGTGLSSKTIANIHGVLHKALKDAVRQGRVARNVAALVDPPRADRPRAEVWSASELRRFLRHVADDRLYALWVLLATTGMRRGEVAGLAWDDLDLDAARVRIMWTLGTVNGKPTWKPRPKTDAGERTMSLDPATVDALRAWRKAQLEERIAAGPGWVQTNSDWRGVSRENVVFTWQDGRMINPDRLTRWFPKHCAAAKLPRIDLHAIRHTYATVGLANATGWHEVKVISERIGHSSVGFTIDAYSHVLPAADEATANTLARVILGEG
jgi:integrase